jgi:hypothetical protein
LNLGPFEYVAEMPPIVHRNIILCNPFHSFNALFVDPFISFLFVPLFTYLNPNILVEATDNYRTVAPININTAGAMRGAVVYMRI